MNIKDIKNWGPEVEKGITEQWKKAEMFKFNEKTKKKVYSIDTPPPYVNAPVHIGQAVTYCYMDFFARYKRMNGYEVLFPLGLDRNGLPIEIAAEKKFGISAFNTPREKFLEYCKKLLNETSSETEDTFAKLGISFTSYKKGKYFGSIYLTDSDEYRALTQETFIDLYKKCLIYEEMRITNWDPVLRTTIADSEVEYKEIPSTFNFIRWKVKETGAEIIIATTRPELICTCGMVIFNPEDERYKHLDGKTAISPIFGKEVKIRSHPLASQEKGTGLAMMCSAGDLSDIQFFREMNLKTVIAINSDGTMNKNAGFLQDLKVKFAREKIIGELKKKGLISKQEKITHRTPVSERSKAEIEFIEMPEFYLKQLEFKRKIKELEKKDINFYPDGARKILEDWIDSISIDWPISRRRFYATEVPLWHSGDFVAVPKPGKYYQPWKENVPSNADVFENGKMVGIVNNAKFKNLKWEGEKRVLDTWMDSSISELYILKYKSKKFNKKNYPVTLRPQGKEIVRTWLYYTLLRGFLETGKMPFNDVWIHQHILDEKGRKMSKSLGNVIDPQKLLKIYGAEAIRLWAATEGNLSQQDLSCSEERIRGESKTINKLLNITKFISQFPKLRKKPRLTEFDQLFIDYFDSDTYQIKDIHYDRYDFYKPAVILRNFLWGEFASHYLELVKPIVYNRDEKFTKQENESAIYTLYYLLEKIVILLHPIIPQVTSIIAKDLKINLTKFPELRNPRRFDLSAISDIIMFDSEIWQTKKEKGLSLNSQISGIEIPKKLKPFEKVLNAAHNII
jgi:valyl-tRNA synthetase